MKHFHIFAAITLLIFASLACQAVMGGGSEGTDKLPTAQIPTLQPEGADPTEDPAANNTTTSSEFTMTEDAFNVVEMGDGSLIFYTNLSAEDAMEFYRDVYSSKGYTEREILTVVTDATFSIVFDGDPSGKALVIQSVDLGDGSRTIAIRLEDV